MKTIDQYIHKATRGLPRKERIDAAAELRAHMLEKIKDLMQQGFPREEATYLAVQEMGSPQLPFAQRVRHFAQFQLPCWMLGVLLLGAGIWWGKDNLFAPKAGVFPMAEIGVQEMKTILNLGERSTSGWQAIKLVLPRETRSLSVVLTTGNTDAVAGGSEFVFPVDRQDRPNNFRMQKTLLLGSQYGAKDALCEGLKTILIQSEAAGTSTSATCRPASGHPANHFSYPWAVQNEAIVPDEFKLNAWIAVAEMYVPEPTRCTKGSTCKEQESTFAQERVAHPERWNVVMLYASDHKAPPPSPKVKWNASTNRWEARKKQ